MFFDVFNGDADGLCALQQLRLAEPRDALLCTGVKRDIALLRQVEAGAGDQITVLDIAVEKNSESLTALLEQGARVQWFDHHHPGMPPVHAHFEAHLDTAPDVCTGLIVDRHLHGRYRAWAVAAAFGDNLHAAARRAAEPLALDEARLAVLRELGECLNYNGYGDSLADLHFHPAELYRRLHVYTDPFAFAAESADFAALKVGYAEDMARARDLKPHEARRAGAIYILPDAAWARRVSGVFANELARAEPARAHAILTPSALGHYLASVRAPLNHPLGADTLCLRFETGGGRKAAAGINDLPASRLEEFVRAFFQAFRSDS